MSQHTSAKASHYDQESTHYDAFNEENSKVINGVIEALLKAHHVKTVLDLTCGTGSQVFWLAERGYEVTGVDINERMLAIATQKAQQKIKEGHQFCRSVQFTLGDMRSSVMGQFDAVLTIFNSIGHLTQADFEKTLDNVYRQLNSNGLYIFDIFNLEYLRHQDNITRLTIDVQKQSGAVIAREIQYSTISESGVLASYDIYHEESPGQAPVISTAFQTLQVYSAPQLREMLVRHGFRVLQQTAVDGSPFDPERTERILTVAVKTSG